MMLILPVLAACSSPKVPAEDPLLPDWSYTELSLNAEADGTASVTGVITLNHAAAASVTHAYLIFYDPDGNMNYTSKALGGGLAAGEHEEFEFEEPGLLLPAEGGWPQICASFQAADDASYEMDLGCVGALVGEDTAESQ